LLVPSPGDRRRIFVEFRRSPKQAKHSVGLDALPYHMVPDATSAAQDTAAVLLARTVSIFPIRRTL
jgi:hypothetical protein